jgi:thioredoxin 1
MGRYRMILRGLGSLVLVCFHLSQVMADPSRSQTVEQVYPGLASHILRAAKMVETEEGVLLKMDGIEISEFHLVEIVAKAAPGIRPELKKNLFFLLEQEAVKKLLAREAQNSGISLQGLNDDQAIQAYLNHLAQEVNVSDMEAKVFYEENKELVGGVPFEQVKGAIQQVLLERKKAQKVDDHIQDLVRRADITINEKWVKVQHNLAMDNPVDKARMSGKPTMVEFGATGCIPCDMMQPILDNLREKYKDRLNVLFVHVREQRILGARFGIRSIPVQVFFDGSGREAFRHVGFYPQNEVEKILASMGIL